MPLEPTVEQRDLRDAVRAALARPSGDAWADLTALGLTEIPFAEQYGGAGAGVRDVAVVLGELGRALTSVPYFSSVALAGLTLQVCGTEDACRARLPGIAGGAVRAALVAGYPFADSPIRATGSAGGLVLDGTADCVVDGADADLFVVVARGPAGPVLAVVDAGAAGVARTALEALDFTRPLARVRLTGVRVDPAGRPDLSARLVVAQAQAISCLAAEQVGAARACLEMSAEYATLRRQFDRPIGSFQAIKHRLADMLVAVELAEAAVLGAVGSDFANVGAASDVVSAAAVARVLASRAAMFAAAESVQIHGGIGFTWEHVLHRYFRRAKSSELLLGDTALHCETVAAELVGPPH